VRSKRTSSTCELTKEQHTLGREPLQTTFARAKGAPSSEENGPEKACEEARRKDKKEMQYARSVLGRGKAGSERSKKGCFRRVQGWENQEEGRGKEKKVITGRSWGLNQYMNLRKDHMRRRWRVGTKRQPR